jgi:hypothetical protein
LSQHARKRVPLRECGDYFISKTHLFAEHKMLRIE